MPKKKTALGHFEDIAIVLIDPCPFPMRKIIDTSYLSLKDGQLQNIIVRVKPNDPKRFEIIAGSVRYQRAKEERLKSLHCLVLRPEDSHDEFCFKLMRDENFQRKQPIDVDQILWIKRELIEKRGKKQNEAARILGIDSSHLSNLLHILKDPEALAFLSESMISQHHAIAISREDDPLKKKELIADARARHSRARLPLSAGGNDSLRQHQTATCAIGHDTEIADIDNYRYAFICKDHKLIFEKGAGELISLMKKGLLTTANMQTLDIRVKQADKTGEK